MKAKIERWCKNYILYLIGAIAFALLCVIFNDFVTKVWVNPVMSRLQGDAWNILLGLICIVGCVYYYQQFHKELNCSVARFGASLFMALSLVTLYYFNTNWNFYTYGSWFKYSYILFLPLVLEVFHFIYRRRVITYCIHRWCPKIYQRILSIRFCIRRWYRKQNAEIANSNGASNAPQRIQLEIEKPITLTDETDTYKRREYLKTTIALLKDYFDNEVSSAIAISGKWGSGKTCFLQSIQAGLKRNDKRDEYLIIEFKPWFSKTPDNIIADFFKVYRSQIAKYAPNLDTQIADYAEALLEGTEYSKWYHIIKKPFDSPKTVQEEYDEIKEELSKLKKKVIITIDDLDRLGADEILAVLRIIRNSANFPYTQFIVTYDKDYIQKALESFGKDYLRKIFGAEISLPQFEDRVISYAVEERLKKVLELLGKDKETLNEAIWKKKEDIDIRSAIEEWSQGNPQVLSFTNVNNIDILPLILKNMRDVIAFTNNFKLNIQALKENGTLEDIDIVDYYWLELMRFGYQETYIKLRNDSSSILATAGSLINYGVYSVIQPIEKVDENKLIERVRLTLLELMFPKKGDTPSKEYSHKIRYERNFFKYFAYRNDDQCISLSRLNSIVEEEEPKQIDFLNELNKNNIHDKELELMLTECLNKSETKQKIYKFIEVIVKSEFEDFRQNALDAFRKHLNTYSPKTFDELTLVLAAYKELSILHQSITINIQEFLNRLKKHIHQEDDFGRYVKIVLENIKLTPLISNIDRLMPQALTAFEKAYNEIPSEIFEKFERDLDGHKAKFIKLYKDQLNGYNNQLMEFYKIDINRLLLKTGFVKQLDLQDSRIVDYISKFIKEFEPAIAIAGGISGLVRTEKVEELFTVLVTDELKKILSDYAFQYVEKYKAVDETALHLYILTKERTYSGQWAYPNELSNKMKEYIRMYPTEYLSNLITSNKSKSVIEIDPNLLEIFDTEEFLENKYDNVSRITRFRNFLELCRLSNRLREKLIVVNFPEIDKILASDFSDLLSQYNKLNELEEVYNAIEASDDERNIKLTKLEGIKKDLKKIPLTSQLLFKISDLIFRLEKGNH